MKRLTYTRKTSLILHNEDYTNAGLKQDDMIKAIERVKGVYMVKKFPINSNIEVFIKDNSMDFIDEVMFDIKMTLEGMLLNVC